MIHVEERLHQIKRCDLGGLVYVVATAEKFIQKYRVVPVAIDVNSTLSAVNRDRWPHLAF